MKRFFLACILIAVAAGACPGLRAQEKPVPKYDGKPLEYWVEKLQKAENGQDRLAAAEAIKAFGPDATPALPKLVELLDDHSEDFRDRVVGILKSLGAGKLAVPALVRSLEKNTAENPQYIISQLGSMGAEAGSATGVLSTFLDNPRLRYDSVRALGAIGPTAKSAIPALSKSINGELSHRKPEFLFISVVIEKLGKMGPESIPVLKGLLEREDLIEHKKYVVEALEQIGPPAKDVVVPLTQLLKSRDLELRVAAARALWTIDKHKDAMPTLVAVLKEIAAELQSSAPIDRTGLNEVRELRHHLQEAQEIMRYLEKITPPVKDAVLEARKYLNCDDAQVREVAADLIFAIDPVEGRKIPQGNSTGIRSGAPVGQ